MPSLDPSWDEAMSFAELAERFERHRRRILGWGLVGALLGGVLFLVVPRTFVCKASLLPSPNESALPYGAEFHGLAQDLGISLPAASAAESRLLPSIFKSERILRAVLLAPIDSTSTDATLLSQFEPKRKSPSIALERAVDRMRRDVVRAEYDEETNITRLEVRMRDPEIAQRTCELLLAEAADFLRTERVRKAREQREFVGRRRTEAAGSLRASEEALRRFREANRRTSFAPELQLEDGRLVREVQLQEQLFLELSRQEEIARIEESRATPFVDLLDPPTPRYEPVFPRLPLFLGSGLLLGVAAATLLAFFAPTRDGTASAAGAPSETSRSRGPGSA